jgi:hypothetical protein
MAWDAGVSQELFARRSETVVNPVDPRFLPTFALFIMSIPVFPLGRGLFGPVLDGGTLDLNSVFRGYTPLIPVRRAVWETPAGTSAHLVTLHSASECSVAHATLHSSHALFVAYVLSWLVSCFTSYAVLRYGVLPHFCLVCVGSQFVDRDAVASYLWGSQWYCWDPVAPPCQT